MRLSHFVGTYPFYKIPLKPTEFCLPAKYSDIIAMHV